MSRSLLALLTCLVTFAPAYAAAGNWSLGAQMSATSLRSGGGDGTSGVLALPANALSYQPGFKVGCGNARHAREATFDCGALVIDESGSVVTLAVGSLGYQHVFRPGSPGSPFADVGLGFLREGGTARNSTSLSAGAGLGLRRVVQDERGALRIEARYDFLRGGGPFGRPNLTMVGLRLGFDLWL